MNYVCHCSVSNAFDSAKNSCQNKENRRECIAIDFKEIDYEALNDIYKELIELVGIEVTEKLYNQYRGQMINFPVRVYNSNYIKKFVAENPGSKEFKTLARDLGCSERWIRKVAKDNDGSNQC